MSIPTGVLMRRGAMKRCPVCGGGHLFRLWVRMRPSCPNCGLVFGRIPGQWLGSWFLDVCVVQAVILAVLAIGVGVTWPDPPMWTIGLLAVGSAVIVPIVFFPFSRTLWTAIDLAMRPLEFDDGVAPGFLLSDDRDAWDRERGVDSPP